nr:PA2928 family protein [uncultured Clostridium sp.]
MLRFLHVFAIYVIIVIEHLPDRTYSTLKVLDHCAQKFKYAIRERYILNFFSSWFYNENLTHNIVLTVLYGWVLFQLCLLTYKSIMNAAEERKHYYFRKLLLLLVIYFILGEIIFLLLRKQFFNNWIPSGWFMQDITLYIIYSVMIASCLLFLIKRIKKILKREKNIKDTIWAVISILFSEFLIGSFVLIAFNGALSNVRVELESPTIIVGEGNNALAVNKMRMVLPNGVERGITTNVVKFTLVAVDLKNGKKCWTRLSGWQEYIIGESTNGLLAVNNKKKVLNFINPKTGKVDITEKEWVERLPELKDNLSYNQYDYYLVSKDELYLYALDGKYYKVDMVNHSVTESPDYKKILSERFSYLNNMNGLSSEDLQWVAEACTTYYSDLLDVNILWAGDRKTALISYHQKRNDEKLSVSMVSLNEHSIKWTTPIDYNYTGMMNNSISVSEEDGWFYIIADGSLYKLRQDNGNIEYVYQYRWNKLK